MFEKMTKQEALEYCYKHENQFKSDMYEIGENGERQFSCLIEILERGTIEPKELPDYGMDYGADDKKMPFVLRSSFTDDQIIDMMDHWFEHYKNVGDSHYEDTPEFRLIEIYWDKVIERVIDDLGVELTDDQIDDFCDWVVDFY